MPHGVLHAQVIVAQTNRITGAALLAVKEVITTSDPANPTVVTMKLSFVNIIVVKFADVAKIFSHIDTTVCTNTCNRLLSVTNRTDNLFHFVPD